MTARRPYLALALIAFLLSCGCSSLHGQSPPTIAGTYIWQEGNDIALLELVSDTDGIRGNDYAAGLGIDGRTVNISKASITGRQTGPEITLTFTFETGNPETLVGRIDGDRLTLRFPTTSGSIDTVIYRRGTVGEYNGVISRLNSLAGDAKVVATATARAKDEQAARARDEALSTARAREEEAARARAQAAATVTARQDASSLAYATACRSHGGFVGGSWPCTVTYRVANTFLEWSFAVAIKSDGSWDSLKADREKAFCESWSQGPKDPKSYALYHADSGVCVVNTPR